MHLCSTNCPRLARKGQHKSKRTQARRYTFIILGKEVMRRRSPNGRKWKTTSLQGESYRRLSTGHSEQSIFFYAHGGSLNTEDGSLITSGTIREAANRLDVALKAVSEGSFKPDREKDKLTYALGTPEHTGWVQFHGSMASVLTSRPIEADPGRRLNRKIRCVPWNKG